MKTIQIAAALFLGLSLVACAKNDTSSAASTSPVAIQTQTFSQSELGSQKQAGPFTVVLMSPAAELKAGSGELMAHVTKDGKDVPDAKVSLALSMPSMHMDQPEVDLKHTDGSAYDADIEVMSGPYEATVNVVSPEGQGAAVFHFLVS